MKNMKVVSIGEIQSAQNGFIIKLKKEYKKGLTGLEGYSHINVVWWADQLDDPEIREAVTTEKPYKNGPDILGIFATRSPARPNPIAVTSIYIIKIDHDKGVVYTPYIDAEPGTPVLDIKPYAPSADIVKNISVPEWCSHWPASIEESAKFNWEAEFNF